MHLQCKTNTACIADYYVIWKFYDLFEFRSRILRRLVQVPESLAGLFSFCVTRTITVVSRSSLVFFLSKFPGTSSRIIGSWWQHARTEGTSVIMHKHASSDSLFGTTMLLSILQNLAWPAGSTCTRSSIRT